MRTLACVWVLLAAVIGVVAGVIIGMTIARGRHTDAPPAATRPRPMMVAAPAPEALSDDLRDVLANLRSMIVVVDASDKVVECSPRAAALGVVRGSELVHERLRTLVRQVRRDEEMRDLELQLSRGPVGPGRMDVGVRAMPLGPHVLLLLDDHTQARRVEEVRRDFVVNVSHELKTPVGGLTLLAEAVDDARDDPDAVHRFAERMRGETTRLTRLVQEIVELSRLQVSDTLDEPVLVDVRTCVQEAVDHLEVLAESRRIAISSALGDPDTPALVYGNAHLITTAVRNLVENAINYSAENTRIAVTLAAGADLIRIVVKDEGSGIPAADLGRIFERFYRVDPARSRRTGGTGLGLAIVKHISANHGGDVTVWSEEGHGSTFTITLPAAAPARDRPSANGGVPSRGYTSQPRKATS